MYQLFKSILLFIIVLITLTLPATAATPIFSGNVETDFLGADIVIIEDPDEADVTLPPTFPTGTISGNDVKDIRFFYDAEQDTLYVGLNTYLIAGDVDGNDNPGGTSPFLDDLGGVDLPDMGGTESFALSIDIDEDGIFDVIAGVSATTDTSGYSVNLFAGNPHVPEFAFGQSLPVNTGELFASPNANAPDLEFTILNFSKLPYSSASDSTPHRVGINLFLGSFADMGISEDFLPAVDETSMLPIAPGIEIVKTSTTAAVEEGSTAYFDVDVFNGGNSPLSNIIVTDDSTPSCDQNISQLAVGETVTYRCEASNVRAPIESTIIAEAIGAEEDKLNAVATNSLAIASPSYYLETTINGEKVDSLATALQILAEDTLIIVYTLYNNGNTSIVWEGLRDNVFGSLNECEAIGTTILPNDIAFCEIRSQARDVAVGAEHVGTAILADGASTSDSAWYQTPSETNFVFSATVNDEDANTLADRVQVNPGDLLTFHFDLFNNGNVPICDLPRTIPPNGGAFCELSAPADNHPDGKRNMATAMVKGFLPAKDAAWYQTPENASYFFRQTVNGRDANEQSEAIEGKVGDLLTFRYSVFNDGNVPLVWHELEDTTFGNLVGECGLPKDVPIGESSFCEILRPAGEFPAGKEHLSIATVAGLQNQNDTAWYKTAQRPEYSFFTTINGQDSDTLESAFLARVEELLTFRYVVINNGNVPIEWAAVNDNIFDQLVDLSVECQLPQMIDVGGSAICNVPYQAPNRPDGEEHISRITVTELPPQQNSTWYQTAIIPRYTFQKTVNGQDANTLETAVQVNYQDPITYRYSLINNGNVPIDWVTLVDEIFGDVGNKCNLPKRILPGGGSFCETIFPAQDLPDGSANISTVEVEGLEEKSDAAWYQTPLMVDYVHNMSINFKDADTLDNAPEVKPGDMLRFRYQVQNQSNKAMIWHNITDSIHGDLSEECGLPKEIQISVTEFCDILRPAETSPGGQQHTSTVDVQLKNSNEASTRTILDPQEDNGWYRTAVVVPGNPDFVFETTINGLAVDKLDEALQTNTDAILTFDYTVINSGDVSIEWSGLSDDVYGNLVHTCELPKQLKVGATETCTIRRAAGDFRRGKRHVGAAAISGLGVQTDDAWYLAATEPDYKFRSTINGQDADDLENAIQVRTGLELEYKYEVVNFGSEELLWRKLDDSVLGRLTEECELLPIYIPIGGSATCTVLRPAQRALEGLEHLAQVTVARLPQKTDSVWYQTGGEEASIGNFVWEDKNQNGLQDEDELGLPNIIVELVDAFSNEIVETILTDEYGNYLFTGVAPGNYRLHFTPRNPRAIFGRNNRDEADKRDSDVDPNTGFSELITVRAGDFIDTVDAAIVGELEARLSALGDFVWEDQNGNGIQDEKEKPIANIEVQLLDSAKLKIASTTTDEEGNYYFTTLQPDTYYLRFVIPEEYGVSPADRGLNDNEDNDIFLESDGLTATSGPIELEVAQDNVSIDAGLYLPVQLDNWVWEDMDGDGNHQEDEPGLGNVQVSLRRRGEPTPIEVTRTRDDGSYTFGDMAPGEYFLIYENPPGYDFTEIDPLTGEQFEVFGQTDANPITGVTSPVSVLSPENPPLVHAGLLRPAVLGGVTWKDENNNGIRDEDELPVPDVAIQVIDEDGEVVEVVESDENGEYEAQVKPGIYNLLCVPMPGVDITPPNQGDDELVDSDFDPVSGLSAPIELVSGDLVEGTNVGLLFSTSAIAVDKLSQGEDADEPSGPTIDVDSPLLWTYEVRNVGTEPLTDIVLVDDLLGEITTCPKDDLIGGESMRCTGSTKAVAGTQKTSVKATASVNGNPEKTVEDEDTNYYTGISNLVDLEITIIDGTDPADAGEDIVHTLVYTNHGPGDALEVTIEDQLPVGVVLRQILSVEPTIASPNVSLAITRGMNLLWKLPELKAGEFGQIRLLLETDSDLNGQTITNTVKIANIVPDENEFNNLNHEETTFRNIRTSSPTNIELLHFDARPAIDSIEVRWVTGAEVDTQSFELYRGLNDNRKEAVKVTPKPVLSAGPLGYEYKFVDRSALSGVDYTYWLVEIENDGTQNEYKPISTTIEIIGQEQDPAIDETSDGKPDNVPNTPIETPDEVKNDDDEWYMIYLPMILR